MQVTVTTIILGRPGGEHIERASLNLPVSELTLRELLAYKDVIAPAKKADRELGINGEATDNEAQPDREYIVNIDDRRIVDLDAVITLRPDIRIEFIKILPLVGG